MTYAKLQSNRLPPMRSSAAWWPLSCLPGGFFGSSAHGSSGTRRTGSTRKSCSSRHSRIPAGGKQPRVRTRKGPQRAHTSANAAKVPPANIPHPTINSDLSRSVVFPLICVNSSVFPPRVSYVLFDRDIPKRPFFRSRPTWTARRRNMMDDSWSHPKKGALGVNRLWSVLSDTSWTSLFYFFWKLWPKRTCRCWVFFNFKVRSTLMLGQDLRDETLSDINHSFFFFLHNPAGKNKQMAPKLNKLYKQTKGVLEPLGWVNQASLPRWCLLSGCWYVLGLIFYSLPPNLTLGNANRPLVSLGCEPAPFWRWPGLRWAWSTGHWTCILPLKPLECAAPECFTACFKSRSLYFGLKLSTRSDPLLLWVSWIVDFWSLPLSARRSFSIRVCD